MSSPHLTVEGFRFEHHVYGLGAEGYDSVSIFIPSKKLTISNNGHAHRSEHAVTSKKAHAVMDQYRKQCMREERKLDKNELRTLMKEADEKDPIQAPLALVDEIDALVEERTALQARQAALDASIAALAQQLF